MLGSNMNRKSGWFVIAISVFLFATGCGMRPNWGPPGTIADQRNRAVLYDPYPSNDLGPPIQGGRPLGFELPRSEATHLQDSPFARRTLRGAPAAPPTGF